MLLSKLLLLPAALLPTIYAASISSSTPIAGDPSHYTENLHLRPLPGGSLYAGFTFTSTTPISAYTAQHYRFFPRALAQILQYTHTSELHLRFSLGRWDEESWGSRPRRGWREGGNGVELWAWLEGGDLGRDDGTGKSARERGVTERWSELVNSLSGLFCASLNFIDEGKTVRPLRTFEPEGRGWAGVGNLTLDTHGAREAELLHGMLPHEVVCTENLTPFLKLLPCKGKAGIASLLDGHKVFDANWQTMSIDFRPICPSDGAECVLEIQQTVDMVLDIERSQRPRDDPIPRPPPIEELVCDEEKSYNADDTCYPKHYEGEVEWQLSRIFGRGIRGSCPLAGKDAREITLDVPPERTVEVLVSNEGTTKPPPSAHAGENARSYTLPENSDFDLHLPQQLLNSTSQENLDQLSPPSVHTTRHLTGAGQERARVHTTLTNPHPYAIRIIYLESLPWFLRPYMHTLHLTAGQIREMHYVPLRDRERPTHLELEIEIPAHTTAELIYDVERAILRYTEYPPDANRGFDVPAAVVRVLDPAIYNSASDGGVGVAEGERGDAYLRTTSLLLPLPTPDFSMPYNVIILTSTVIALGFGSVFNLLVRRFVLVEEVPVSPMTVFVRKAVERGREIAKGWAVRVKKGDNGGTGDKMDRGKVVNGALKEQSKKDR